MPDVMADGLTAGSAPAMSLEALAPLMSGIFHEFSTPLQYLTYNLTFLDEACADLTSAFSTLSV